MGASGCPVRAIARELVNENAKRAPDTGLHTEWKHFLLKLYYYSRNSNPLSKYRFLSLQRTLLKWPRSGAEWR